MRIVKVTLSEVEQVAPLFDRYRVFYGQESNPELARAFIHERVANTESIILLALDEEDKPQGFTQLYPTFSSVSAQRSWILNDLYVSSDQRGKGIGKALLKAAEDVAVTTGAKGIALETAVDNHNAQKLYESLGYERDSGFYGYFLSLNR